MKNPDNKWLEGRAAAIASVPLNENPYRSDERILARIWSLGWENKPLNDLERIEKSIYDIGYADRES